MSDKNRLIPLEYQAPHYSTKMWKAWHQYLSTIYSPTLFNEICATLKVDPSYLLRDGDWVSHSFTMNFVELAKKLTGDEKISQRIGEYTLHPDFINPFEYTFLKLMPVELFFLLIPAQSSKLNKLNYFMMDFNQGYVSIAILSRDNSIAIDNEIILNTIGVFEAASKLLKLSDSSIAIDSIQTQTGTRLKWKFNYAKVWVGRLKKFLTILVPVACLYVALEQLESVGRFLNNTIFQTISILAIFTSFVLIRSIYKLFKMHSVFEHRSGIKNDELYKSNVKLERRYQEANHLRNLANNLIRLTDSTQLIDFCLTDLSKKFNYQRSVVMLLDQNEGVLYSKSALGFDGHADDIFKAKLAYPGRTDEPQLFANILAAGETKLISDIENFKVKLTKENQGIIEKLKVKSLIISPIQYENEKFGLLMIGSVGREKLLNGDDKFLIDQVTRMLSFYFRNAQLFQKETTLKNTFQKYVPAAVIDGLDKISTGSGALSPKNTEICSVFVDLRGFTAISEKLMPDVVATMLNRYYEWITSIFAKYGGIVDNLVGDGVIVFFPNLEKNSKYVEDATKALFEIIERIDEFRNYFESRHISVPGIGIGMDAGLATLGSLGGSYRLNYTAIGDVVNTASRLEGLTKVFSETYSETKVSCVVSKVIIDAIGPMHRHFSAMGEHDVRGKKQRLDIFYTNERIYSTLQKVA